ncbi:AMP-binding protein [Salinicola rhizosphaerae]|uniref:Long-chain acyl-CoA synthetase n=1 Tax=Salinicola rhizosphaerae TaxID=1443141 RepID=A0ABQ3E5L7_9GAMM|nr:AMP-binding protein [Salinicola rhizosphaerae]GHB21879.1 long-chain acyl-CoA synthetase [Salinicola rhizosphaerae]
MLDAFFEHLETLSRQRPDQIALADAAQRVSYAALLERIAERGARLKQCGATRVGLALDNGVDWALWDLAMMRDRIVCVPLPSFFSPTQVAHVLDQAGIDTVIGTPSAFAPLGFTATGDSDIAQRECLSPPKLPVGTQKITFTSGTSGSPKGVCLDSDAPLKVAESLATVTRPCDIQHHLTLLPLATLLENIGGIYAPLWLGARVTLPSLIDVGWSGASGFDSAKGWDLILAEAPDSLILVPQLLSALLARQGPAPIDFGRFFAVGGATVSPELLRRAQSAGWPVFEGYGLSECASVVSLNRPGEQHLGSVGRPLPHVDLQIDDDGEIHAAGALMLGYLGEPSSRIERWPTGDLGEWQDATLHLKGRRRQVFITAYGRNVDPAWVEAELTAEPVIAQAWVYGEAQPANRALLVPGSDTVSEEALQAAVARANERLPDYARISRWRVSAPFTPLNGLATANGRLRREALETAHADWLAAPITAADTTTATSAT